MVTGCLSSTVSRTPRRINVKKVFICYFIFFIYFLCAYVLSGRHARTGEQRRRQHEDLMYFSCGCTEKTEFQKPTSSSFTAFGRQFFLFFRYCCFVFFSFFCFSNSARCESPKIWNVIFYVTREIAFRSCRGHTVALRSCLRLSISSSSSQPDLVY